MEWKQAGMKVMDLFANSGIGRGYFIRLRHAVLDRSKSVFVMFWSIFPDNGQVTCICSSC